MNYSFQDIRNKFYKGYPLILGNSFGEFIFYYSNEEEFVLLTNTDVNHYSWKQVFTITHFKDYQVVDYFDFRTDAQKEIIKLLKLSNRI